MAESNAVPPEGDPRRRKKDWKLGRAFCYNHHRHVLLYSIRFQPPALPGRRGGQFPVHVNPCHVRNKKIHARPENARDTTPAEQRGTPRETPACPVFPFYSYDRGVLKWKSAILLTNSRTTPKTAFQRTLTIGVRQSRAFRRPRPIGVKIMLVLLTGGRGGSTMWDWEHRDRTLS